MRPRLMTAVLALSLALPAGGFIATSAQATPTPPWPASPPVTVQTWSSSPVGTYEVAVGADRSVYVTTPTGVLAFSWDSANAQFVTPPRTITPPASGTGSTLLNPEGIAVSPDGTRIAVAYDGNGSPGTAGVAVYPASASGATTPVRIVGQPAGASLNPCGYVRGVAWDSADVIYAAACGYSGASGWPTASSGDWEVWAFPSTATATDAPSRVIGPYSGWGEFTHMSIVGSNLAVTGSGSSGRPVAFAPLGSSGSGALTPSEVIYPDINPNFGFTADADGWMYISSFDTPGRLMALAPGSRGATTALQVVASGVPHSVLGFDPVDGSVIAVEWGGGCCLNGDGTRTTGDATAAIRRVAVGGAVPTPVPSATPTPSASATPAPTASASPVPSTSATPTPSAPDAGPGPASAGEQGGAAPAPTIPAATGAAGPASESGGSSAGDVTAPASASPTELANLVGLRLIARGSTGRTCLGAQCVTGRRWALQMCLPNEASISVQRRTAKRWTTLPARLMNVAPLNCPAPTRSVTVAVPRRSPAGIFRILLRVEGAPSLLSNLRVT